MRNLFRNMAMTGFLGSGSAALPFGEETITEGGDTLTWDGNTEGLVNFGGSHYKISDVVLTLDDCANGVHIVANGESAEVPLAYIQEFYAQSGIVGCDYFFSVPEDNYQALGLTFPEAGVYFCKADVTLESITIPGYTGFVTTKTVVKTLDEKYMPLLTSPSGKKFKLTVDDSGVVGTVEVKEETGGFPIAWNTMAVTGNPTVEFDDMPLVKVSGYIPSVDDIKNTKVISKVYSVNGVFDYPSNTEFAYSRDMATDGLAVCFYYCSEADKEYTFVAYVVQKTGYIEEIGTEFSETGVYVINYGYFGDNIDFTIDIAK